MSEEDDYWTESDNELLNDKKTVKIELSTSDRERQLMQERDDAKRMQEIMAYKFYNGNAENALNPYYRPASPENKGSGGTGNATLRPEFSEYSQGVSKPQSENPKDFETYHEYNMIRKIGEMQNRGATKDEIASRTMADLYEAKFHAKPMSAEDVGIDNLINRIAKSALQADGKSFKITATGKEHQ